jgi:hypothetical protein
LDVKRRLGEVVAQDGDGFVTDLPEKAGFLEESVTLARL